MKEQKCPKCKDSAIIEFVNIVPRKRLCQICGHIWKPKSKTKK